MTDLIAFFGMLFLAAAITKALTPEKPGGRWDNSRAATQRDVADVVARGGRSRQSEGGVAPLIVLLFVVIVLASIAGWP